MMTSRPEYPRPEYPRPHFDRSQRWATLNGTWRFMRRSATDDVASAGGGGWDEEIVVPFAWETPASGVEAHWLERASYRRGFTIDESWRDERVVLHFGAVHHEARVWVDGTEIGTHVGGMTPFEFDITDALTDDAEHTLVVSVFAPADKLHIVHGKQRSTPRDDYDSCAFTASSGIWQPVWLEPRPRTHLATLRLTPTPSLDGIRVVATVAGPAAAEATVSVSVEGTGATWTGNGASVGTGVTLPLADVRLWSPADPHLYRVRLEVSSPDGTDVVTGTTGVRSIETRNGQIFLNGQRISLRGVLDQGYWPLSGITAPHDEAFVRDLEIARDAGFNMVRKHLKLEDPRFHHHADRMGMLVWAEPASTGRFSTAAAEAFSAQIEPMVLRDGNHPSIVVWGLYNEEWGLDWALPEDPAKQEVVRNDFRALKALDPTRPAVDNSGWTHLETDLVDWHVYDETPAGWAAKVADLVANDEPTFPVAIAVGSIVDKRLMVTGPVPRELPFVNSEFGGGWTSIDRGWNLHWQTQELRRHDMIAGWVWTELNDIEHESAGIVDCNRTMKDHGGRPPQHANGETVPVFGVTPLAPGCDLITSTGEIDVEVAVSHHGTDPMEVTVAAAWGPVYGLEPATEVQEHDIVQVEPFVLSKAARVRASLPAGSASGRLHVLLRAGGSVVGRGAIDVVRA